MEAIRKETRRTFIEGEGWHVEEVEVGAPLASNQAVVAARGPEPAVPVVLKSADVPLSLARQVIEANGLVAVPLTFLNEEQLAELKIDPGKEPDGEGQPASDKPAPAKREKLTEAQAIKAVTAAKDFDELNALTRDETRPKVLNAAEARAAELKKG